VIVVTVNVAKTIRGINKFYFGMLTGICLVVMVTACADEYYFGKDVHELEAEIYEDLYQLQKRTDSLRFFLEPLNNERKPLDDSTRTIRELD
tara:strand:- start:4827 stop:5102 length:276 start_codon:yes stop_codon:yes gene_type:complete